MHQRGISMTIKNTNEKFGDSIEFFSIREMETAIENSGYELPEDGLVENRDYEVVFE